LILLIKRCLQASLAETQRRTARDQGDIANCTAKITSNDIDENEKERQVKIAMNAENNLTTERLKTAELTVDELRLRKEQEQTAIKLQNVTQRNLGR
jgi:hypothetical protein